MFTASSAAWCAVTVWLAVVIQPSVDVVWGGMVTSQTVKPACFRVPTTLASAALMVAPATAPATSFVPSATMAYWTPVAWASAILADMALA